MTLLAAAATLLAAAAAQPGTLHVPLRQTVTLQRPGATAAYAVNAEVADVTAAGGEVQIHGRGAGTTQIAVVTATDVETFPLVVDAPPPRVFARGPSPRQELLACEALYDSASTRLTNSFDVLGRSGDRLTRLRLTNVTRMTDRDDADARSSFAWASLEVATPRRRLVLLDDLVDHSPLTLDGTSLRGIHYRDGGLELHAGYTSPLLYGGFLLSSEREAAAGASYRLRFGPSAPW